MQNNKNTWNDLVSNWTQMDGDIMNDSNQIKNLKEQLKNRKTSNAIELFLGLIFASALSGYIIYEIVSGLPSVMDYTLYSGVLTIILISALVLVSMKSKRLKGKAENSLDYINLLYKQALVTQMILKVSKYACVSLFLLCYGIIIWVFFLWLPSDHVIARPIMALILVSFVSVFFPSLYFWIKAQQTKNHNYIQQLKMLINDITV